MDWFLVSSEGHRIALDRVLLHRETVDVPDPDDPKVINRIYQGPVQIRAEAKGGECSTPQGFN